MFYKSEFMVNAFHLHKTSNPEGLLTHLKKQAATEIGIKLCGNIPFTLNEEKSTRRRGVDLNNYPPINPVDAVADVYETEFFAVSRKNWSKFREKMWKMIEGNYSDDQKRYFINLLKELESK